MRKDLGKVLTEKPRRGHNNRNMKTGFHENGYDSRENQEDKYSLPKRGKMLMRGRDIEYDEGKEFTDVLNPLKRWVTAQVGRNWDTVYSEIRTTLPNTNKQNHHVVDTHLMSYINRNVVVIKSKKGRKVYDDGYRWRRDDGPRELFRDEIYVDPDTHVLMKYRHGKDRDPWKKRNQPRMTPTGFIMRDNQIALVDGSHIENINGSWVQRKWVETKHRTCLDPLKFYTTIDMVINHPLSKKELKLYGLANSLPCDGKIVETGKGYYKQYGCTKCAATFAHDGKQKHGVVEKDAN